MSASNAFETDLLELIFNGTTIPNLADDAGSSPATSITVALHTSDPGEGGDQSTNEATYTGYTRVQVDRDNTGWVVSGNQVSPAATISFPAASGGSETITHFSVGTGVGDYMLISGTVSPTIAVSEGVTPQLSTSTVLTVD